MWRWPRPKWFLFIFLALFRLNAWIVIFSFFWYSIILLRRDSVCAHLSCKFTHFFISEKFSYAVSLNIFPFICVISFRDTNYIMSDYLICLPHYGLFLLNLFFFLFPLCLYCDYLNIFFYFRNLMFSWAYSPLHDFICSVACYFGRMVFCQIISHSCLCLTWEALSRISNYSYRVCQNFQFYVTPSPDYQRTVSLLWLQQF